MSPQDTASATTPFQVDWKGATPEQMIQVCGTVPLHPGQNTVTISNGQEQGTVSIGWDPPVGNAVSRVPIGWGEFTLILVMVAVVSMLFGGFLRGFAEQWSSSRGGSVDA